MLNLEEIVNLLKEDITDLDIKTCDIKYNYETNKNNITKNEDREKKIIIS